MGCSSSSAQTVDQEKRPATKPEESNGDTSGKHSCSSRNGHLSLCLSFSVSMKYEFYIFSRSTQFLALSQVLLEGCVSAGLVHCVLYHSLLLHSTLQCLMKAVHFVHPPSLKCFFPWSGCSLFLVRHLWLDIHWISLFIDEMRRGRDLTCTILFHSVGVYMCIGS